MSKQQEELLKSLQKLGQQKPALLVGTVESVDKTKMLIDVEVDGVTYFDVSLRAVNNGTTTGFLIVPSVGSFVVIGSQFGGGNYNVVSFSDVDEVFIKGDEFGGMVKATTLTDKLNNLENKVNSIISIFNTHTHTSAAPSSPTTTPIVPITGTLTPTTQSEIENEKIKNGNS